jgi:hypothetical protein
VIKVRTWVGLDVHAAKVVACVVDAESLEKAEVELEHDERELSYPDRPDKRASRRQRSPHCSDSSGGAAR